MGDFDIDGKVSVQPRVVCVASIPVWFRSNYSPYFSRGLWLSLLVLCTETTRVHTETLALRRLAASSFCL